MEPRVYERYNIFSVYAQQSIVCMDDAEHRYLVITSRWNRYCALLSFSKRSFEEVINAYHKKIRLIFRLTYFRWTTLLTIHMKYRKANILMTYKQPKTIRPPIPYHTINKSSEGDNIGLR